MVKYVWNIANKEDNLWVKWVNHVYIKEQEWWQYVPPVDSCWYWKKVCACRDKFAAGFVNNSWLKQGDKYTVQSGYQWYKGEAKVKPWYRGVWGRMNVPKHSFTSWLAMHRKLLTKERLQKLKIYQDSDCMICERHKETVEHLFFECKLSEECLKDLLMWMKKGTTKHDLKGIWRRIVRGTQGKRCREFAAAVVAALIYRIWWARNEALWNQRVPTVRSICAQVKEEYKARIVPMLNKKCSRKEREWIDQLYGYE